ncbi:MAG TPA: outer membrane beta-barrel protein [Candidatus Eisenbacteria bacterium]|nr:outer membrane beta-barrel protein [Candidatus Eisenbacteria bacterium]
MRSRKSWIPIFALAFALAGAASRSEAREIYISPMFGYTTAGSLDLGEADLDDVKIEGGLTWGGQLGFSASPGFTFEASYMQQETELSINGDNINPSAERAFELQVAQLHGNFLFEKIGYGSTTRPYFLLGLGATFFNPSGDFDTESRFSFSIGAGVKIEASEKIGLKIQGKYNPTYLDEDYGGVWCDPFYCYQVSDPDYLDQGEFAAGLTYKLGSD